MPVRMPRAEPTVDMTPAIELRATRRAFGSVVALDAVSLTIAPGEFFALLGPSGSGKTTCLRLIAGFDQPDSGTILLDGEDVTNTPPFARNVNTVFQDYALFPHMTVAENVAYGLRVRGVGDRRAHASRPPRCSTSSDSASSARVARTSSPAASGSAWHWPAR